MLIWHDTLVLALLALLLDGIVGDPHWLWRRLPHPVVWFGKLITLMDAAWNRPGMSGKARRTNGVLCLFLLVSGSLLSGLMLQALANLLPFGWILTAIIAAVLIAQKSLVQHVAAVRDGLGLKGLEEGRRAVSMIVGRDPDKLDESGIARAAIESAAENVSDGVVAPLFWFALLGLPGLIAYKAVNTADSMIGHKTERYADFGWASARFDDLVNLPASRLTGLLIAFSAPLIDGSPLKAYRCIRRDAGQHRSPNAGWPEAAMAGSLNVALAGPRVYADYRVDDPYMNAEGRKALGATDISRALTILYGVYALQFTLVAVLAYLAA